MEKAADKANPARPRITVVIVTYQSRELIASALDGLKRAQEEGLVSVVVVDNASGDGTADFVCAAYPSVRLVRNPGNVGFGRGCNVGFGHSDTPYVILLNPDAAIGYDSIKILADHMDRNPRAGICGPAVIWASGEFQSSGSLPNPFSVMLAPFLSRWVQRKRKPILPGSAPETTDWICGSIMMVSKAMLEEIGAFDPRFFLYFEETDLCRRARRAGWEIWTVGAARGEHANAASAKASNEDMAGDTISEHYFKSRYYYLTKHHGRFAAACAELGELALLCARAVVDGVRRKPQNPLRQRLRGPVMKLPDPVR